MPGNDAALDPLRRSIRQACRHGASLDDFVGSLNCERQDLETTIESMLAAGELRVEHRPGSYGDLYWIGSERQRKKQSIEGDQFSLKARSNSTIAADSLQKQELVVDRPAQSGEARTAQARNENIRRSRVLSNEDVLKRIDESRGSLDLSDHWLPVLPPEIGTMETCITLHLRGNRFSALPPEIGRLYNLITLNLDRNQLITLPPEIGSLYSLQTLHLRGNELSALPSKIGRLRSLATLSLDDNQLTALPSEIGLLKNLTTLSLRGNDLKALPAEIGSLRNLTTLDLRDNHLSILPSEIGSLPNLRTLDLRGNPLSDPLPALVEGDIADVLTYLRSLEDAEPQYVAKLLLVGEGNIGKTSLVAALRDEDFVEKRPTTHGIEQSSLVLPHPYKQVEMSLNVWDFGGQEVYRITNQFFFSAGALYVLVWWPREGREANEIESWCRRIRLRVGAETKILIVATYAEDQKPELDYPQLQRQFGSVLGGHFAVDNSNNLGIPELRIAIAGHAAELPSMGELLSASWRTVRDELLARAAAEPQIAYDAYMALCTVHGIDEDAAGALARLLHELGHIIYYGQDDGLRDVMVLQPEWLTKAIGQVLDDKLTGTNGGVLDHRRVAGIWGNERGSGYPMRHHPYFLRLMEKFDVSYRIPDEDASLVGQLVPFARPSLPWDGDEAVRGARSLALVCRISEPVEGLMAWLTVRHHRFSTGLHWRRGVFLEHKSYGDQALLELLDDDRSLGLTVHGPSPDAFFSILRDGIEYLLRQRWQGLDYELLVPCPGPETGEPCGEHFKFRHLVRYREELQLSIDCHGCRRRSSVTELLTGFSLPDMSLDDELTKLRKRLDEVHGDVKDIKAVTSQSADQVRRILRAISEEVIDCPRLFTLVPVQKGPPILGKQRHRLTLWCEHPDRQHPCAEASYDLSVSREWVRTVAPYVRRVVQTLSLLMPVAGAVAGAVLSPQDYGAIENDIERTRELVASLPDPAEAEFEVGQADGLTHAEGAGLRALRTLLFEQDLSHAFGGLRRRQTSSGDFVWICPDHYPEYDPGLPRLPERSAS